MTEPIKLEWTDQQSKAMELIADWVKNGEQQVFTLFGYAGTGKTTLVTNIAEGVEGRVLFGSFTGKAASVLHKKGCLGAQTIHSMIYRSREKSKKALEELKEQLVLLKQEIPQDSDKIKALEENIDKEEVNVKKPFFTLNPSSDVVGAGLVVIDECSMVDQYLAKDLLSFGTKLLVIGDPAQLPPVKGKGTFVKDVEPEVLLTEIHRQAQGSPILKLATMAREKKYIEFGDYGDGCKVVSSMKRKEILDFDQVLVGKNVTRRSLNNFIRNLLGRTSEHPEPGDKVVCLRNNPSKGLLNGMLFTVVEVAPRGDDGFVLMSVQSEDGGEPIPVSCYENPFYGEDIPHGTWGNAEEFDYGYALTVHKSQGSQWNNVLLVDESNSFKNSKEKWLYTGITRAAEKITIRKGG